MQMKIVFTGFALLLGLVSPAVAVGDARLEKVKARAASDKKLIAFVVMQECKNGNCPIAVNRVGERNTSVKKAVPNKGVIVVKLDLEDLDKESTPACVRKNKNTPSITVTNADCTEVIDSVGAGVDKARAKEMETKIEAAIQAAVSGSATAKSGD